MLAHKTRMPAFALALTLTIIPTLPCNATLLPGVATDLPETPETPDTRLRLSVLAWKINNSSAPDTPGDCGFIPGMTAGFSHSDSQIAKIARQNPRQNTTGLHPRF